MVVDSLYIAAEFSPVRNNKLASQGSVDHHQLWTDQTSEVLLIDWPAAQGRQPVDGGAQAKIVGRDATLDQTRLNPGGIGCAVLRNSLEKGLHPIHGSS